MLHWGAGAYVVGEETALIESLEGNRGMPRLKPPFFPAAIGLYGQPTIVNNVETLSNLPWLARNGAAAYTAIGTETSPGTRMVAVSGHVKRPGVYEIVNGTTTFRDLLYGEDFCGGIRDGHAAEGVRARRRLGAVVRPRPARPPVRGQAGRRRRIDARLGRDHGDGRDHRHPGRRARRCAASTPTSRAASACRAARAARGCTRIMQRIVDGDGTEDDLDQLLEVGESICPGDVPARVERAPRPDRRRRSRTR